MSLSVIGAGLGRTGTLSLKVALEMLGLGRCYHMVEVGQNAGHVQRWSEAVDSGTCDWDALFEGFGAAVDWPPCHFWRELAAHYPDALVVLTVRDAESWIDSASATIFQAVNLELPEDSPAGPQMRMARKLLAATMGGEDVLFDRARAVEAFERHNETVAREVPPDRLLVYEAGQGWEPLCERLGVPVPDVDYPRTNDRESFQQRLGGMSKA